MKRLEGKVALITGSSRGIARCFALEGARVALHGRDEAALTEVQATIRDAGGVSVRVLGDVTRFDYIERMRQDVECELGSVDILVANAGGSFTMPGPFDRAGDDHHGAQRATNTR